MKAKKQFKKDDLFNDESNIDKEIEEYLKSYTVENVPDEDIEKTIDVLRTYMPREKEKNQLLHLIYCGVTYIDRMYYIFSIAMIIIGAILVNVYKGNRYIILMGISPLPMIIGIYEVIKGKMEKMWELEKSFKYSYSKVVLSRLLIVTSIASIINMCLSIFINYGESREIYIRSMTCWIVPLCIISSISLLIINKTSTKNVIVPTLCLWIILLMVKSEMIVMFIENTKIITLAITIFISLAIFICSLYRSYKSVEKYEGEMVWN